MYKLVIADDDEIQLQGMCCAFPWEELDIEVAAGVDDGDKALKAAVETGDLINGAFMAGSSSAYLEKIEPVETIIQRIMKK